MKLSLHLLIIGMIASCSCSAPRVAAGDMPDFKIFKSAVNEAKSGKTEDGVKYLILDTQVDDQSVAPLIDAINSVDQEKYIVLEINSPGGSITDGFRLVKAIENSKVPVQCVVDGDADSMAFYILESCNTRIMTKRSVAMAHQAAVAALMYGHQDQWANVARRLKAIDHAMSEFLASKMHMKTADFEKKIEGGKEWWMNSDEALNAHAIDYAADNFKDALRILDALANPSGK